MLPSTYSLCWNVARQQVARSGNMNFVDGNKQHVEGNMLPNHMLPWCELGLSVSPFSHYVHSFSYLSTYHPHSEAFCSAT